MRPRVNSSRKSVASRKEPPEPPYSSAIWSPYQPSSPIRAATSCECPSWSGRSNFSRAAKSRIAATKASCSSLSLNRFPRLEAVQLAQRNHHLVDLVRAVGDPQPAALAPRGGERDVVGHPERAVHLHGPVEHALVHLRRDHLDHRDVLARGALALRVHPPGGVEHHQPRLVDLHAGGRDEVLYELL